MECIGGRWKRGGGGGGGGKRGRERRGWGEQEEVECRRQIRGRCHWVTAHTEIHPLFLPWQKKGREKQKEVSFEWSQCCIGLSVLLPNNLTELSSHSQILSYCMSLSLPPFPPRTVAQKHVNSHTLASAAGLKRHRSLSCVPHIQGFIIKIHQGPKPK